MTTNRNKKSPRSTGRPPGSPNVKEVVDVEPSRCPKCKSSERGPYLNTTRREFKGAGTPFCALLFRRCQCLNCGQIRIDRTPVYEATEPDEPQQITPPDGLPDSAAA
ncbi:hypothetical protein [Anatilimnocola floriformis]|uniref:hypothetical protein n=1 Tax=Anatilimnocola floriformis TaxID=2948575 RepID=UPI0020C32700|nr:hypothetical protein [Anatilimnocola floriformis]